MESVIVPVLAAIFLSTLVLLFLIKISVEKIITNNISTAKFISKRHHCSTTKGESGWYWSVYNSKNSNWAKSEGYLQLFKEKSECDSLCDELNDSGGI